MTTLLFAGAALLLLLGLGICLWAVISFSSSRRKRVAPAAPAIAVAVAAPTPPPPPPDDDATAVVSRGYGTLHATTGPLSGQSFALRLDGLLIGRDRAQAEVVVEDPSISKKHVWVGVRDGAVLAVDQASTNGTYLNSLGSRIGEVRLAPGDTLILSDDAARFVYRA